MARSIAAIQNQILSYALTNYGTNQGDPFYYIFHDKNNVSITPSRTNKFVLIAYIVAVAINLFEQLLDIFRIEIENKIALAPPGTPKWLQNQIFLFQYSATTPQIVQVDPVTFQISYPTVNESMRLITQCAVVNNPFGGYVVKVAAGLAPITTPQLNALTSYLNQINFGVPYLIINTDADLLMLGAEIFYDGQYSPSIATAVKAAINAYIDDFNSNNFNGLVYNSKLEDIIQAVPGVIDVVLKQVEARASTVSSSLATKLIDNSRELLPYYATYAGYIIIDTDSGRTLDDTLTFTIQN